MRAKRSDALPLLGAAGAIVAVGCCAGLPAFGAIVGGLTVAAVLGIAGGVPLAAVLVAGGVLLRRSRRSRRAHEASRGGVHE